ncbi:NAD(P)H-binding protein [Streptacidiphilus griseoplanus]|uniref:NAD(P)H-binding protein n=1 Tax=Peterkaempfera griseoplana TaxID=66896 RepID=UPI0006E3EBDF|nr:NAD(P)H-binding protein [Peterkaempfera griseoplana]
MILVTAATGTIGRPLVARLSARGVPVRALTRTPATASFPDGVQVCGTAEPDLHQVDALVLNLAGVGGDPSALLDAARAAGVRRIVTVSSLVVTEDGEETGEGSTAALHRELEAAVEAAAPEWTHLRPGGFAANALQWVPQLAAGDVVRGPHALARTSPVHEADLAAVAVRALLGDELLGRTPRLTGPQVLTTAEQVAILGRVLGRPLRHEEISPEAALRGMLAANPWIPEQALASMLRYLGSTVGGDVPATDEVRRILGRPARTFAEWAADHADAFRPAGA